MSPKEPRITERLVGFVMAASFPFPPQTRSGHFYLIATIRPIPGSLNATNRAISYRGGNTTTRTALRRAGAQSNSAPLDLVVREDFRDALQRLVRRRLGRCALLR